MTYYDTSLYQYLQTNRDISIDKLNRIFLQCIVILESIHKLYVIHRDIKPQNFMLKNGELFLIDFGLSIFYVHENGEHIDESSHDAIIGTPKYISLNIHNGISPSRRDDLISIGYMYIFMFCRELPWENITNSEFDNNIDCFHGFIASCGYTALIFSSLKSNIIILISNTSAIY